MIERPQFYTFEGDAFVIVWGGDDDERELHPLPNGFWAADGSQHMDWDDATGEIVELVPLWRERLWAAVKVQREALLAGGCETPRGWKVQTSEKSLAAIDRKVTAAMADPEGWSDVFTLADNSDVLVDAAAMLEIKAAVEAHEQDIRRRARDVRDDLFDETILTVANLRAIVIDLESVA